MKLNSKVVNIMLGVSIAALVVSLAGCLSSHIRGVVWWILGILFIGTTVVSFILKRKLDQEFDQKMKQADEERKQEKKNEIIDLFNNSTGYAKELTDLRTAEKMIEAPNFAGLSSDETYEYDWDLNDYSEYCEWLNMVDCICKRRFGDAKEIDSKLFSFYKKEETRTFAREKFILKWLFDIAGLNEYISKRFTKITYLDSLEKQVRLIWFEGFFGFCRMVAASQDEEFNTNRKGSIYEYMRNCFTDNTDFTVSVCQSGAKRAGIMTVVTYNTIDYSISDYCTEVGAFYRNPKLFAEKTDLNTPKHSEFFYLIQVLCELHNRQIPWRNELVSDGNYLPAGLKEALNGDTEANTVYNAIKRHAAENIEYADLLVYNEKFLENYQNP